MQFSSHHATRRAVLERSARIHSNAPAAALVARALDAGAHATPGGAIRVGTGAFTGRSPRDKLIVRDGTTEAGVDWQANAPMTREAFEQLFADAAASLAGGPIEHQELLAGADPARRYAVTVLTPSAWHALFIRNLLIRPDEVVPASTPARPVTILHAPQFEADPARHGTRGTTAIALDPSTDRIVICGTSYAGEIKKAVFSLFCFHAPDEGVLPMHCSANLGADGEAALFFGLSGTGKTTLSSDPARPLIGDDEHGWSDTGVFNLEGGCYAKTAKLSAQFEPEIFAATGQRGTVLENVVLGPDGVPDFNDLSLTENTRAAYPITTLPAVAPGGTGLWPRTVVFLTADAFGVLPPLARLTRDQAVEHFLLGYTAKIAGTERGVTEPQATFSACYGAPFMMRPATVYGDMLAERLETSGATVFLLNTGWTGGGYGVGRRIDIATTRRLLAAILSGALDTAPMRIDPHFGLAVPLAVEGVDDTLLDPRAAWADGATYDAEAARLSTLFARQLERFARPRTEAAA